MVFRARRMEPLHSVLIVSGLLAGCEETSRNDDSVAIDSARLVQLQDATAEFEGRIAEDLRGDAAAMMLARDLFAVRCESCHSEEYPEGDVPNLTVGVFDYGGDADSIRVTIAAGRSSVMPPMGRDLGEVEIGQVVSWLMADPDTDNASLDGYDERGRSIYAEQCAACHGGSGEGVPAVGGPDLTDSHWQHGGSMMNIRLAITRGVESHCPGAGIDATKTEVELLTAWVLALSKAGSIL